MFYLLQKFRFLQYFTGVCMVGWLCFILFGQGLAYVPSDIHLPYSESLTHIIAASPILSKIAVFVALLLQLIFFVWYSRKCAFVERKDILPACLLPFLMLSTQSFLPLSPVFITNLVILLLLILNTDYDNRQIKNRVLVSGALIGIASLYELSALLLLIYVISTVIANRYEYFKEIAITFIGFILPYIFAASYHYFVGDLSVLIAEYQQIQLHFPLFSTTTYSTLSIICLALVALMIPFIIIKLKFIFDNKLIIARKRLVSLNALFVSLLLIFLTTNIPFPLSFSYLFIPFAVYFSVYTQGRFNIMREILMTILLFAILAIGNQW